MASRKPNRKQGSGFSPWNSYLARWSSLIFFGVLLLVSVKQPATMYFDEVHYIPAAKALITFTRNINYEHPPLAKWIFGLVWLVFTKTLGWITEPMVFRLVGSGFGLSLLWCVRAWMIEFGFGEIEAQVAVFLSGFNFLWFALSHTAIIETTTVALAFWGLYFVFRYRKEPSKSWMLGWALLGLSISAKWSSLPYLVLAAWFSRMHSTRLLKGTAIAVVAYLVPFLPLSFLKESPVFPWELINYHKVMLAGLAQVHGSAKHNYQSSWWEWATLLRPIWLSYEQDGGTARGVWAGGNPLLFWSALPVSFYIAWSAFQKRKRDAVTIAAVYWFTYLAWTIPTGFQMFYYFLGPSLWLGPMMVWLWRKQGFPRRGLIGYALACGALFLYFLPILDGRLIPASHFSVYMWLQSWI